MLGSHLELAASISGDAPNSRNSEKYALQRHINSGKGPAESLA